MAATFKMFVDKMGGRAASAYIGTPGEIFYDPTSRTLRVSDGTTPGGTVITFYDGGNIRVPGGIYGESDLTIAPGDGSYDLYLVTSAMGSGNIIIGNSHTGYINIGESVAGSVTRLKSDGIVIQSSAPSSSKGQFGDEAGMFAFSSSHAFFCTQSYSTGTQDIWRRVALTGGAW